MIKWFFGIISGESGRNCLSIRYSRFLNGLHSWRMDNFKKGNCDEVDPAFYYCVDGAGFLRISKTPISHCGDSIGFSIGVSWNNHPYVGGVIDSDEAELLAKNILSAVESHREVIKTRRDSWNKSKIELSKYGL